MKRIYEFILSTRQNFRLPFVLRDVALRATLSTIDFVSDRASRRRAARDVSKHEGSMEILSCTEESIIKKHIEHYKQMLLFKNKSFNIAKS